MQSAVADAAEARILKVLNEPMSGMKFDELPLQDVVEHLKAAARLEIQIDTKALEDASIGADAPVTRDLPPMTLRSALGLILWPMDLTWVIKNEVLMITTPEKAGNELITRIYLVRDLVTQRNGDRATETYQQLIDLITATISPTVWDEVGGPCAIHEFRGSGAIVCSTTRELHEQIEPLLAGLRQARAMQFRPHEFPVWSHGSSMRPAQSPVEQLEPVARYIIKPNASWLVPQVHAFESATGHIWLPKFVARVTCRRATLQPQPKTRRRK